MKPSAVFSEPRRLNPEELLQRGVVEFLRICAPPYLLWYACPNGGVSKGQNGRNKAMGVRPGIPDLHFVLASNEIAYIELKAGKNGLSPEQQDIRDFCLARGIHWAVCRSVEEVEAALRGWGVKLKATTLGRAS